MTKRQLSTAVLVLLCLLVWLPILLLAAASFLFIVRGISDPAA